MADVILSQKLKNALKSELDINDYSISLKNININGNRRGCSGFITNLTNGVCIYVYTEINSNVGMLYRYAESVGDYTGAVNHFVHTLDDLVSEISRMAEDPIQAERELTSLKKQFKGEEAIRKALKADRKAHKER